MKHRHQSGIALLEVIVAMSLLSLSFAMLLQSQTTALRLSTKANLAIRKLQASQSAVATYRAKGLNETRHVFSVSHSSLLGAIQCSPVAPNHTLLNCQYSFSDMPERNESFIK